MNAIAVAGTKAGVGDYATIHITPEREFSYVSYETNIETENYLDLVKQVVDTFKPGKMIITFYATRVSYSLYDSTSAFNLICLEFQGCKIS